MAHKTLPMCSLLFTYEIKWSFFPENTVTYFKNKLDLECSFFKNLTLFPPHDFFVGLQSLKSAM